MSAKKVDRLDSNNFDDYCSGYVNHIAKWDGAAWKALYTDSNEIEAELQKRGRSEINSRVVGDLAVKGLLKLDHIAYIRYASVYLRMDDLHAIRDEIDHLLSEEEK